MTRKQSNLNPENPPPQKKVLKAAGKIVDSHKQSRF
jgi:hypothetical protein